MVDGLGPTSWIGVNSPVVAESRAPEQYGELSRNVRGSDQPIANADSYPHVLDSSPEEKVVSIRSGNAFPSL